MGLFFIGLAFHASVLLFHYVIVVAVIKNVFQQFVT